MTTNSQSLLLLLLLRARPSSAPSSHASHPSQHTLPRGLVPHHLVINYTHLLLLPLLVLLLALFLSHQWEQARSPS